MLPQESSQSQHHAYEIRRIFRDNFSFPLDDSLKFMTLPRAHRTSLCVAPTAKQLKPRVLGSARSTSHRDIPGLQPVRRARCRCHCVALLVGEGKVIK